MNLIDIKNLIEGFTGAQKRNFNKTCNSKIYTEGTPTLTQQEEDDVNDAINSVEALSTNDLADLIGMLVSSKKLSKRPC